MYDVYYVKNEKGKTIGIFRRKKDAIRFLKDHYKNVQDKSYIVDCKGNIVFDWL